VRVELYRFDENGTITTLTSSSKTVVYNGETYTPTAIGRKDISSTKELSKASLKISLSVNQEFAQRLVSTIVDENVYLILYSKTDGAIPVVEWRGRLASVKPEEQLVTLVFESIFTSLRITGLRKRYQRTCPYVLYGKGCLLDKDDFAVAATVTATSGLTLTIAEASLQDDGFYTGGMIADSTGKLRFISIHAGDQITMVRELFGLLDSSSVTLYPGCDRSITTCNDKFDNKDNFGGFPYIPIKNPFTGSSIA
jgi:uncharacterized phage protein (TIGR02218 family)